MTAPEPMRHIFVSAAASHMHILRGLERRPPLPEEWCCRRWGRGCVGDEERLTHSSTSATTTSVPTTTTAPTTTTLFNCVVGFAQWEKAWRATQDAARVSKRMGGAKAFSVAADLPGGGWGGHRSAAQQNQMASLAYGETALAQGTCSSLHRRAFFS